WSVVYIANNDLMAEKIKNKLSSEGFMVQLRELSKNPQKKGQVEILVPRSEAQDVVEFLSEFT
ncbi:MAG: glutamate decarboxylase, partial [Bacillus sp. (in: Bacteria)]|nr:glutamate decarboxylase [Bacillus sp. (in: firmicutes)]